MEIYIHGTIHCLAIESIEKQADTPFQSYHSFTYDMGSLSIRVHIDITGEMWFGVG